MRQPSLVEAVMARRQEEQMNGAPPPESRAGAATIPSRTTKLSEKRLRAIDAARMDQDRRIADMRKAIKELQRQRSAFNAEIDEQIFRLYWTIGRR